MENSKHKAFFLYCKRRLMEAAKIAARMYKETNDPIFKEHAERIYKQAVDIGDLSGL